MYRSMSRSDVGGGGAKECKAGIQGGKNYKGDFFVCGGG